MDLTKYVTHVQCQCKRWIKSEEARAIESGSTLLFFCEVCGPKPVKEWIASRALTLGRAARKPSQGGRL